MYWYSTASTEDAVFIIGGSINGKRIAEYKNGKWTNVGELEKARYYYTRSITFGGQTMIVDGRDPTVEIWNLEQSKKLTTFERQKNLVIPPYEFYQAFEVFLIPKNFC